MSQTSTPFHASWSTSARDRLEAAATRHGGWPAWHGQPTFQVETASFTGGLATMKGHGKTFTLPIAHVKPAANAIRFVYPGMSDRSTLYQGGRFTVEDRHKSHRIDEHRASFRGLRKLRRWSDLDIMYFMGNGLPIYLGLPFLLAQAQLMRHRRVHRGGRDYDRFSVLWPKSIETHSQHQVFEFDDTGLFSFMEYTAEIVGKFPRARHYASDWIEVAGLQLAQRRTAKPLVFGHVIGPTLADLCLRISVSSQASSMQRSYD